MKQGKWDPSETNETAAGWGLEFQSLIDSYWLGLDFGKHAMNLSQTHGIPCCSHQTRWDFRPYISNISLQKNGERFVWHLHI